MLLILSPRRCVMSREGSTLVYLFYILISAHYTRRAFANRVIGMIPAGLRDELQSGHSRCEDHYISPKVF